MNTGFLGAWRIVPGLQGLLSCLVYCLTAVLSLLKRITAAILEIGFYRHSNAVQVRFVSDDVKGNVFTVVYVFFSTVPS